MKAYRLMVRLLEILLVQFNLILDALIMTGFGSILQSVEIGRFLGFVIVLLLVRAGQRLSEMKVLSLSMIRLGELRVLHDCDVLAWGF